MDIKKKIEALPDGPGVYLMKDKDAGIIYIGKTGSLKNRVRSYFNKGPHSYKTGILAANVADIDYIPTGSEEEALLLEAALVKEKQPRFNVMLKDDKRYPLLKLTMNERFPRLVIARKKKSDGAMYFGPYTNAKLLRKALGLMRRIFPLRVCGIMPPTPCLNYHIGQCIAPCLEGTNPARYRNTVGDLMLFLKGRKKELLVNLSKRMREASKNKAFEEAARLRDQIRALGSVGRKAGLFSADRIEGFDISDISGKEAVGSMVSFLNGKPDKSNYRRFRIKTVFAIDDYKMMQEVIRRRYKRLLRENGPIPAMIIIDGGKGHVNAAKAVLAELHLDNIKLFGIAKKEDRIFSSKGEEHIAGELKTIIQRVRDEAHRFAQGYHHILRRKRLLEE
jgi:excinuclease ABC subunit C